MTKYLSEQTLRTIQYRDILPKRLKDRRTRIRLACSLALAYYPYHMMRDFASMTTSTEELSIQEVEERIMEFNRALGVDFSLSDYLNQTRDDADISIDYYKEYKGMMKILEGKDCRADVVEQLFKELYKEYEDVPLISLLFGYCYDIAMLTLKFMCSMINYEEFLKEATSIKFIKNPDPFSSGMLKMLIKIKEKLCTRYMEIADGDNFSDEIGPVKWMEERGVK
jgi:hypothetical protein